MSWNPNPIPVVYPLAAFEIQENGRTRPLTMRCEIGQSSDDYVVKLWNNVELSTHGLAREVYGSLLAQCFNLNTPAIALVEIDPDFAKAQPNPAVRQTLANSPGLNFGSQYIRGAVLFNPPASRNQISVAARVFCFDMLIGNVDRRHPRINLFQKAESLILYDHEQAFPYSRPRMYVGGFPPAWEFPKEVWSKNHILYPSIKGKPVSLEIEEFVSDLLMLNEDILTTIEEQIPPEWQADVRNISLYLSAARDNAKLFERTLQELLA